MRIDWDHHPSIMYPQWYQTLGEALGCGPWENGETDETNPTPANSGVHRYATCQSTIRLLVHRQKVAPAVTIACPDRLAHLCGPPHRWARSQSTWLGHVRKIVHVTRDSYSFSKACHDRWNETWMYWSGAGGIPFYSFRSERESSYSWSTGPHAEKTWHLN